MLPNFGDRRPIFPKHRVPDIYLGALTTDPCICEMPCLPDNAYAHHYLRVLNINNVVGVQPGYFNASKIALVVKCAVKLTNFRSLIINY